VLSISSTGVISNCVDNGSLWVLMVLHLILKNIMSRIFHRGLKNVGIGFYFENRVATNMCFTIFVAIRFPDALGDMVYQIYGQGELPQAFCRRAAVKGCIHVSSSLGIYNLAFLEQCHLLVPYCFLHPGEYLLMPCEFCL
jgi:hypothetical protein